MLGAQKYSSNILFSDEERRSLSALLDSVIPASEKLRMPSAANINFIVFGENRRLLTQVNELIKKINILSLEEYETHFYLLNVSQILHVIDLAKSKYFRLFHEVLTYVVTCYYQHVDVLEALGLNQAPFPYGNNLNEGDLSLLEPVYERGKIYRETILDRWMK
jgi:hypothetical protein